MTWNIRPGETVELVSAKETLTAAYRSEDTIHRYFDVMGEDGEPHFRTFYKSPDGGLFTLIKYLGGHGSRELCRAKPAPQFGVYPWPGKPRIAWRCQAVGKAAHAAR